MSAGISSVLPSATYAGALTEFWANAGSGGGGGGEPGVTQIVAGSNITISPGDGQGVVTINASGGGAGGVTSLIAGPGIAVSGATGAVTVSNTAASINNSYVPQALVPQGTVYVLPYVMTPGLYLWNFYGSTPVGAGTSTISLYFLVQVTPPSVGVNVGGGINFFGLANTQYVTYAFVASPAGAQISLTFAGGDWASGSAVSAFTSKLAYTF